MVNTSSILVSPGAPIALESKAVLVVNGRKCSSFTQLMNIEMVSQEDCGEMYG